MILTGCAAPTRPIAPADTGFWQGRLSLLIATVPPHSFSAGFELSGQSYAGTLLLNSPLGNTLAELAWTPENATLRSNGALRSFESLDALLQHTTGTTIPVGALFAWVKGEQANAIGWVADVSQISVGRLYARRTNPEPPIELRLVLQP